MATWFLQMVSTTDTRESPFLSKSVASKFKNVFTAFTGQKYKPWNSLSHVILIPRRQRAHVKKNEIVPVTLSNEPTIHEKLPVDVHFYHRNNELTMEGYAELDEMFFRNSQFILWCKPTAAEWRNPAALGESLQKMAELPLLRKPDVVEAQKPKAELPKKIVAKPIRAGHFTRGFRGLSLERLRINADVKVLKVKVPVLTLGELTYCRGTVELEKLEVDKAKGASGQLDFLAESLIDAFEVDTAKEPWTFLDNVNQDQFGKLSEIAWKNEFEEFEDLLKTSPSSPSLLKKGEIVRCRLLTNAEKKAKQNWDKSLNGQQMSGDPSRKMFDNDLLEAVGEGSDLAAFLLGSVNDVVESFETASKATTEYSKFGENWKQELGKKFVDTKGTTDSHSGPLSGLGSAEVAFASLGSIMNLVLTFKYFMNGERLEGVNSLVKTGQGIADVWKTLNSAGIGLFSQSTKIIAKIAESLGIIGGAVEVTIGTKDVVAETTFRAHWNTLAPAVMEQINELNTGLPPSERLSLYEIWLVTWTLKQVAQKSRTRTAWSVVRLGTGSTSAITAAVALGTTLIWPGLIAVAIGGAASATRIGIWSHKRAVAWQDKSIPKGVRTHGEWKRFQAACFICRAATIPLNPRQDEYSKGTIMRRDVGIALGGLLQLGKQPEEIQTNIMKQGIWGIINILGSMSRPPQLLKK